MLRHARIIRRKGSSRAIALICSLGFVSCLVAQVAERPKQTVLTGQAAFTDAAHEAPGIRRHLTAADLPAPNPSESVDNGPSLVPRPQGAWPVAP